MTINLGAEFDFEDYKRNVTDTKRPDCFIKKRGEEYPQVVFEVGYAATFEKLEEDAHRWLRGSNLVHRVFLVKIDKNDKYELFKETVVDNVENIPHGTYCGRRSCVYNLPAEQLQRYFERTDENIDELKKILDAWHKENFPILEDVSATLYVYGWSVSDTGDLEIGEIGREVYYPADNSQCSVAPSLEIATNDLFGDGKAGIGDNTTAVSLPIKDLRARIDQGIEEHIAKSIRKLVSGLRREYLHWKQSPPTTDIVVQTVRNTNESIPWNALLEETRPKPVFRDRANPILYHLQSLNTQSRLRALTEEVIMELRASTDCPCPLPFEINCRSFMKWSELLEKSGYEYDGKQKAI